MMLSSSLLLMFAAIAVSLVVAVPNVANPVVGVPTNAINDPSQAAYSTATLQNTTNMMATLMSYLYGSLMPALMAQQQRNNTTQDAASVPTYPLPSSYYSYPSAYPTQTAEAGVNERVSRAASTENSVTEAPAPKNLETLPLDIIKHAVQHNKDINHHHHHHKKTVVNNTTAPAIELPIVCPKCGAKMKLLLSLATADGQTHDFCTCEDNKSKYFCECAQPQICTICNKVKKYTSDLSTTWKPQQQQPHSIIIVRKTNPTTPRRNIFTVPSPPTTTIQPISYDGYNMWAPSAQAAIEPTITKRYAENVVYAAGYEQQQQQQQEINNIINAFYEAVEHEPTCYCWRCRFIRRY